MKKNTQAGNSRPHQHSEGVGPARCSSDKHRWEFFDNFPGHEIFECQICKQKKFVDLKTGRETYE
jgi:hypothetical protein